LEFKAVIHLNEWLDGGFSLTEDSPARRGRSGKFGMARARLGEVSSPIRSNKEIAAAKYE
jgi:hypothetical protein